MKVKYFLRGLGTGIILTALVLCVSYRSGSKSGNVVEQARELGMVFPAGTKEPLEPTALPDEKTAAPEQTAAPTEKSASGVGVTGKVPSEKPTAEQTTKTSGKPSGSPSVQSSAKPSATARATKNPVGTVSPVTAEGKKFTVRGGLISSSIAREMKAAGIIKDADAFDEYLEKNGYARKVRAGIYYIPKGSTYDDLARIITRQN
ncbi:MAG: hypothetical protein J1F22_03175 [Lachnospiraceae bacterium]|nr:hypothetical protein [Lachnospiraceae bacterium]